MRTSLIALLSLALVATASVVGYRVFSRDYRYFQLVQLGDELLGENLPFQASRTYASALVVKPDDPIAYVKRAEAERRQGNLAAAVEDLEFSATLSSDVLLVSLRLGDLYYEVGRFDDAATQYQKVVALDPRASGVLYKLGLVYFRGGREAEAIDALTRAVAIQAGFWEAYYLRGAIFRSLGRIDEAESDFQKAIQLSPDSVLARGALIELYINNGEPQDALELVQAEIDANPGVPGPYLHLSEIHRLAGRRRDAIEAVSLAIEQDPNLPAAYRLLGELWLDESLHADDPVAIDKAAAALQSVVKMDPEDGRASLALGRTYLAMNDEPRGFTELQRATHATPVPAEAHRLLGDLYRARDNDTEAVTAYLVFLRLRGDDPAVLERLGDTYTDLDSPELAADTYLKLSSLEPRRIAPLVKAARALIDAGDNNQAMRICRQGLAANPNNRALLSLLSQARGS